MVAICVKKGDESHDDIIKLIVKENIITSSMIGIGGEEPEQWRRFLKLQNRTDEELIILTNHPNGVVRCYAFHALVMRNHSKCIEIFKIGLADMTYVDTMFGCIKSQTRVRDYFIKCVLNPKNEGSFNLTKKRIGEICAQQGI